MLHFVPEVYLSMLSHLENVFKLGAGHIPLYNASQTCRRKRKQLLNTGIGDFEELIKKISSEIC